MALRTLAPPMPNGVKALIREDYVKLDPHAPEIFEWMRKQEVFHEFAHARDTFIVHFRGTWGILRCWNQPMATARCGLLHSAYTRAGFYFRLFDIENPGSRAVCRDLVGIEAEEQIWKYCYTQQFWNDLEWIDFHPKLLPTGYKPSTEPWMIKLGEPLNPAGYTVPSRIHAGETVHMSAKDIANYFVVFVADIADQWSDVSTYRNVYHEEVPGRLWPGTGRPSMPFNVFSKMLRSARPYLDVIPPVFNNCTEVISFADEYTATDCYWKAVQGEHRLEQKELEALYRKSAELNPYIGEPHVMLSQCCFKRGAFAEAAHHAISAIDLLQQWATQWDKRNSFSQWLGFARMMLLRSKRRMKGLSLLPSLQLSLPEMREPGATYLQDVVAEFDEYTADEVPHEDQHSKEQPAGSTSTRVLNATLPHARL